ncbi:hypothetical protein ACNOYE_16035 [Nannocystaceae bacterium ST9]
MLPSSLAGKLAWALAPLGRTARDAPFLLAIAGLLIAVVWGALTEIGAPSLFWHEHPSEQFLAGVATAVLAWELAFLGYLLASCEPAWCDENSAEGWLVRTVAPMLVVLALAPLGPFAPRPWGWFVGGLAIGSLAVVGLRRLARALLRTAVIQRVPERSWFRLPRFEHRLQLVFFAAMLAAYFGVTAAIWLGAEPKIPAAAALCLGLGLVAGVYGFVRFNFERHRKLIYLGLFSVFAGIQALTFGRAHRLDNPGLDYAAPVDLARPAPANPTLLDDREVLERWRARFDRAPRLVVVASSGGGLRASLWTARVLTELEAGIPGFADHVRLVTGASGGMVGAGIWVATLQAEGGHGEHDVVDESGREALGPITLHLTMPLPGDRGEALDRALVDNSEGALAIGLRELADDEAQGRRPSLVYAPIMVEDGRPMLFSNLELEALCSVGIGDAAPTTLALEFYRLFPAADPPLATLARLSASAPLVSPAVQLPTLPSRSLVDAGFADPYGVDLATRWIARHAEWLRANTAGVVLVQIRDRRESWREVARARPHPWLWRAIAQIAAPGESIVRSRRSTIGFRNELEIAQLAGSLPSLTTVVFELDAEASLSWSLSEHEKTAIQAAIHSPENQRMLGELRSWWTDTEPSAHASAHDDARSKRNFGATSPNL